MKIKFTDVLTFIKIRISISVSISAILGYILSANAISNDIFVIWLSVLLLASGSAALNQVQEWQFDAKMERTKNRPLPKKVFSFSFGLLLSLLLIFSGLTLIFLTKGWTLPLYLGISAIIIYNAIYTPLKRVSPFAAIPGAFIGAIPPMMGWTFAGGDLLHPLNLAVASFFFIWQIPHFWLLLIVYEDDYRKAGFPVLTDLWSHLQIARISFLWIVALVLVSILNIFLLEHFNILTLIAILSLGMFLILRTHRMVTIVQPQKFYKFAFINLNMFVLLVTVILSFQKILNL